MSTRLGKHDFSPSASLDALEQRAALLKRLREFFDERGFLEIETPLLSPEVIPELHIEPVAVHSRFLQASPELYMKRLLAAGASAIYQVTRSFRSGERGALHSPEFTIVEWYRVSDDMPAGIDLLDALAQALLNSPPSLRTTYAEAFQRHLGVNPHATSIDELTALADAAKVDIPTNINRADRDEWLNLLLAMRIEPQLGRDRPEILYHYPATQSALAKTIRNSEGFDVAERFELYYRGVELANGYHELSDAAELRRRLEAVNTARIADGRRPLPMPETLLMSMESGLPDCTGCALGFDRLAMVAVGASNIAEVIAFPDGVSSDHR